MKTCLSTILALFVALTSAQANIVIDDFDQVESVAATGGGGPFTGSAMTALNDAVSGMRSTTVESPSFFGASSDAGGGGYSFVGVAGSFVNVTYDFGPGSALNVATGPLLGLSFEIFEGVLGTLDVFVDISNTGGTITESFSKLGVAAGDKVGVARDDLSVALAGDIDIISLTLATPGGVATSNVSAGAAILAVPEPSSIALLGLTGLGGIYVARRRRKAEKAA